MRFSPDKSLLLPIFITALHINPEAPCTSELGFKHVGETKLWSKNQARVCSWEPVEECRWFGQIGRWEIEKWPQHPARAIWQPTGRGRAS